MALNDERELRTFQFKELRVDGDKSPKITGYAAVFDQPSEDLGGFIEYVRAGCFTKTIQEYSNPCFNLRSVKNAQGKS